jgi:hypothetical protein
LTDVNEESQMADLTEKWAAERKVEAAEKKGAGLGKKVLAFLHLK